MKKLLVVLMAAMMVLSMAAVSMAAATVEGDWRTEWVQDESSAVDDLKFYQSDLRLNFKGKVSDSVDAYMQWTFGRKDGAKATDTKQSFADQSALKEWYVTFNQSWGKAQAGQWDYKLVPSRVLLKPHTNLNCVNPKSLQLLFDISVGDASTFGLWIVPTTTETAAGDSDMHYDLKYAYKADSWGAEVHYGDKQADKSTYVAFDFYYNINDDIKAFVYGVNADDAIMGWEDNLAPVIGATWKNVAGSKLTASLEYALEETDPDYTEYALQFKYGFTNKVNLEVEYQTMSKDDNKLIIRPRVKF